MAMVHGQLIWEIVKKNNSFLVKKFSKEPNNLCNIHSFNHSGLPNKKTVTIQPRKDQTEVLGTTKTKKQNKPNALLNKFVVKEFHRMDKAVSHQDLHSVKKTDHIVPSSFTLLPFSLHQYLLKPRHSYTTACVSVESLQEETELAGDREKIRDTAVESLQEETEFFGDGQKIRDTADVFQEWGCSESDISKIFERRSSLRKMDVHNLRSKLEILSRLGIKSTDLVKMVHCRPRLLNCKINIDLNERLVYLEGLFGSKEVLVKAIVRNPSLLTYDFHNKVKPVIAMYESLGLCKEDLITVLLSRPTLIPRTNLNEEKLDYIRRTGVSEQSKMYKHVVSIVAISRMETIREKMMHMEKYGLSEDDYLGLVGRSPLVLTLSVDKVQRNMTYVIGTMKLSAAMVVHNPFLIFFNLDKILKPRFQIACKIEDMGLAPQIKGPLLLRAMRMSDKRFIKAFISCHPEDVAEELLAAFKDAKCVRRLAESSKKNLHAGFPF